MVTFSLFLCSAKIFVLRHLIIIKKCIFIFTRNEILEVQIAGGDSGGMGHGHLVAGLAIKNPPKKPPKKPQQKQKKTKKSKTPKNTKKPKKTQKHTKNQKNYKKTHWAGFFFLNHGFLSNPALLRVRTAAKRRVGFWLEQKSWRTETAGASSRLVVRFMFTMACAAS